MKALIVNGDDFGASRGTNRGILEAHQGGILTSTSMLVDAPGSEDGAQRARALPQLSIGLHVDLPRDPKTAVDPRRLRTALDDQLRRFERLMGRPPTHVDSHHNVHRDRELLPAFLDLAREHGLPLREHSPVRYVSSFYGQWGGKTHLEQIGVENLAHMLAVIGDGITELACHPGYVDTELATSYSLERETEVRTLCHPSLRAVLAAHSIQLVSYHDFGRLTSAPT